LIAPPVLVSLTEIDRPPVLASLYSHKSTPLPRCLSMLTEIAPLFCLTVHRNRPPPFCLSLFTVISPPVLSLCLVAELPIVIHDEENSSRKNVYF